MHMCLRVILFLLGLLLLSACDAPPPRYQEAGLREVLVRPRADLAGWSDVRWGQNRLGFHKSVYGQYLDDAMREDTRDPRNVVRVAGFDYYIDPQFEPDLIALRFESLLRDPAELRAFVPVLLRDFVAVYGEPAGEWSFTEPDGTLAYYEWRVNATTITLEWLQPQNGAGSLRFRMQRQAGYRDVVRIPAAELGRRPLVLHEWFGLPVMLVRRSAAMQSDIRLRHANAPGEARAYISPARLALTAAHPVIAESELDPFERSLRPGLGVFLAVDPMAGCALGYFSLTRNARYLPAFVPDSGLEEGFYSTCGERVFDAAGRPAGTPGPAIALLVPAHHYTAEGDLVLGVQ